jgi:heat shock protein HslJ
VRALATPLALLLGLACGGSGSAGDAPSTLVGTVWRLERIQMMDDTEKRPHDPSRYTLQLLSDGAAAVRADCNRGRGSYQLDGPRLTFGPLATTRAMCPPGSLSDDYLKQLAIAASWRIADGRLAIATAMDSSILFFVPAP